jgi:ABC-2 type transport system ATP-binding protein
MTESVVSVRELKKEYRQGFFMRRVMAVSDVSLEVERGSIFGFIGPNGAGKTTTLKVLMGLVKPTSGTASLFGVPVPNAKVLRRVGFLPENPYIYPYLTSTEFVEMCAVLSGLRGRALRDRTRQVLDKVGMLYAADRSVRKLSKGMLQRTGLAAALVADPELLVLDEPMSGLDPVGRKEVRDIILDERRAGRTILFSTHILSDVETICDRVAILRGGSVVLTGDLGTLLRRKAQTTDIYLAQVGDERMNDLQRLEPAAERVGSRVVIRVEGSERLQLVMRAVLERGYCISEVIPRQESLEDLFVREALGPN